jgi:20S proteasome subunit beta 1
VAFQPKGKIVVSNLGLRASKRALSQQRSTACPQTNNTLKMQNQTPLLDAVNLGTSIMAVEFEGGVVMGADSRTTTGAYVANRVTDKITPIHDHICVCRSGSAADTQAIADYVHYLLDMHSVELGEPPLVKTAANLVHLLIYSNKQLLAGMITAGWDRHEGGQVYSISLGGALVRQPFAIGGSGSTYIYGYCDSQFRRGMSRQDCINFVTNALALAMSRDGSSGGVIRLAIIDHSGIERRFISGDRLPTFFEDD